MPVIARVVFAALLLGAAMSMQAQAPASVWPEDAVNHVGQEAVVCGFIVATHPAPGTEPGDRPDGWSCLFFNAAPPDHPFMVYVEPGDLEAIPFDLSTLGNSKACVHGIIGQHRGRPAMRLLGPDHISYELLVGVDAVELVDELARTRAQERFDYYRRANRSVVPPAVAPDRSRGIGGQNRGGGNPGGGG